MAYLNTIDRPIAPEFPNSVPFAASLAARQAEANFAANQAALARTQPRLAAAVGPDRPAFDFVFGRDGYLTAFDDDRRWWSGCSLPKRANAAMLRALKTTGPISCLLAPPHAASVCVALEMTPTAHAIVVLVPDSVAFAVLLACDDFSAEIQQHRLWFAHGEHWTDELLALFDDQSGLPTPTQFIRLPVTEQTTVERLIASAQTVFAGVLARRSAVARDIRNTWRPPQSLRALCVLTTRQFSLWNDAALTLGVCCLAPALSALSQSTDEASNQHSPIPDRNVQIIPIYLDEPLHGSPLALLSAAVECGAVVTADVARADMMDLLPRELPWITWMTTPRVPAFAAAGPKDALLVADPDWKRLALDGGWPADRVAVARWPDLLTIQPDPSDSLNDNSPAERTAGGLAIIADTWPLDPPEQLDDFSSQRLLWNSIRRELEADPLILAGIDPAAYLDERLKRFGVSGESLDLGLFTERLIVPCYGQGIARLLIGAGLPLRLHGNGWSDLPEFAQKAEEPIRSRAALRTAAIRSAALVHVRPMTCAHPIDAAGRPVVRPMNKRTDTFIRAAVESLKASGPAAAPTVSALSVQSVLSVLGSV